MMAAVAKREYDEMRELYKWIFGVVGGLSLMAVGFAGSKFWDHESRIYKNELSRTATRDAADHAVTLTTQHGGQLSAIRDDIDAIKTNISAIRSELNTSVRVLSDQISTSVVGSLPRREWNDEKAEIERRFENIEMKLDAILDKLDEM